MFLDYHSTVTGIIAIWNNHGYSEFYIKKNWKQWKHIQLWKITNIMFSESIPKISRTRKPWSQAFFVILYTTYRNYIDSFQYTKLWNSILYSSYVNSFYRVSQRGFGYFPRFFGRFSEFFGPIILMSNRTIPRNRGNEPQI